MHSVRRLLQTTMSRGALRPAQVLGKLVDEPHPVQEAEVDVLPGDVPAAAGEDAGAVAKRVPDLVDVAGLEPVLPAPAKVEWRDLLEAEVLERVANPVDPVAHRVEVLAETAGCVPPLAEPDELAIQQKHLPVSHNVHHFD